MESTIYDRKQVLAFLAQSPHRKLDDYVVGAGMSLATDPDFYAHLVAWNERKGEVRDAKLALPLIGALTPGYPEALDNHKAHFLLRSPRDMVRGLEWAWKYRAEWRGSKRALVGTVERYLRALESNRATWDRVALQHRGPLKTLYARNHIRPSERAKRVLFEGEKPGVFGVVADLPSMSAADAAAVIVDKKIPFLVAVGALGSKLRSEDGLFALVTAMSPAELTNNTKMLEKLGMSRYGSVRALYSEKLSKAATSTKGTSALKLSKAADAVEDEALKARLNAAQEKRLDSTRVDGDWLVIADKSGSMQAAIDVARQIAAVLSRVAKGQVRLVFCNTMVDSYDVTGKTLDDIRRLTARQNAQGGTSLGIGVRWALDSKFYPDGIAIISDGGENQRPLFYEEYREICEKAGKTIPAYLYRLPGDRDVLSLHAKEYGCDIEVFDLTRQAVDYYSLPNLAQTMRTNRFSLTDEVMGTRLLTVDEVLRMRA